MKKQKREITVEFEKIVGEGKALGHSDGKVIFCYGVLPNETAKVITTYEKKNFAETELLEIIKPSPHRIKPKEEHYMCCSPWQIMEYSLQAEIKQKLIEEALTQTTKTPIKLDEFYKASNLFGYRTKVEYSFTGERGSLALAFHKRGNWWQKIALPNACALLGEKTNKAAIEILKLMNAANLSCDDVKTLIIRETKNTNECIAALYLTREDIILPEPQDTKLDGFLLVYSVPNISSSITTKIIRQYGKDFLTEEILGKKISFGFDCFFQNNIPLFTEALKKIKEAVFPCKKLVDLYSGVGVIGLTVGENAESLLSIEASAASAKYAPINAKQNGIKNYQHLCSLTEKADYSKLENTDILIVDPPRSGLHEKVMAHLLELLPKRIIYLSCNPITQGRDAAIMLQKYNISYCAGLDFYPNTPHAESLVIFDKKL